MTRENFQLTQTSGESDISQLVSQDNGTGPAQLTSVDAFRKTDSLTNIDSGAVDAKLSAQAADLLCKPGNQKSGAKTNATSDFIECTSPFDHPLPARQTSYEVKNGDTLWEIARKELRRSGVENPTAHETKLELQGIINANKDNGSIADARYSHILPGMHLNMPQDIAVTVPQTKADATGSTSESGGASSAVQHVRTEASKHHHKTDLATKAHRTHHHYLHDLESKIFSIGRMAIDGLHHWLDAVAGKSFLLAKQDAEANGVHIQLSSAGRTYSDQARLYKQLHKHQSVALPGTSNHETGLAIDVTNWRQAKPYLLAHGFVHGDGHGALRNDPWHFKYVGLKVDV